MTLSSNVVIHSQIRDMGIGEKIFTDALPLEALEPWRPQTTNEETPLGLEHLQLALIGLCLGLLVAFVAFAFERLQARSNM